MAYNSQDERLLVKGNERITRQLKVGKEIFADCDINAACDVNVTGSLNTDKICSTSNLDIYANCANVHATSLETDAVTCIKNDLNVKCTVNTCNLQVNGTVKNRLEVEGDIRGQQDIIAECDLVVHGNLLVDGSVTASTETQVATTGDYLVTRENNNNALTSTEYSGLAVNNYSNGKMATLTSDYCGTWRVSDSATNTSTTYTDVSEFNGQFYDHLTQTTTSGPTGVMTDINAIELSNVVLYNGSYYHKEGENWFGPVSVVNGIFDLGSLITDSATITALEALTAYELIYYNTVKDNHINVSQNQPLLTRDEESNLENNDILVWDSTNKKAVPMTRPTVSGSNLTANVDGATSCVTYAWATGITATNSICFNGCTYAQAKADILSGNAASATNATKFNGCTFAQACTAIRSGLTSCVGTVTIADKAAANANTPVALCTGATSVGKSGSCGLNFNTCTGALTTTQVSVTTAVATSWSRAPIFMSNGASGASKVCNVVIRACCTDANCALTCRNFTFCGSTGYMHGNVCGNLCGTASTAASATYATKVGRTAYSNAYDFDIALTNNATTVTSEVLYVSNSCRLRYCNTTGTLKITNSGGTTAGTICANCFKGRALCADAAVTAGSTTCYKPQYCGTFGNVYWETYNTGHAKICTCDSCDIMSCNLANAINCVKACAGRKSKVTSVTGYFYCGRIIAVGCYALFGNYVFIQYVDASNVICKIEGCATCSGRYISCTGDLEIYY